MDKIPVLYFLPVLGTGGTEKIVLELCRQLDRSRFEAEICAFYSGGFSEEMRRHVRALHILVEENPPDGRSGGNPLGKALRFRRRVERLRKILEKGRIGILHTHHIGPLVHALFAVGRTKRRPRWIHTEHNRPDLEDFYRSPLYRALNPLRGPDAVTGVSAAVIDFYRERGVTEGRCHAILNGIDAPAFAEAAAQRGRLREELGLFGAEKVVGSVGNLREEKNHQLLLRAFALVAGEDPGFRLVLCGDGPCRPRLETLAKELGIADRTLFLGHRLDVPEVMSTFDVFCLPSRFEGMPLSILEAWAAGKPVVGTDVIGIRELVVEGEGGLLVPPGDPEAMAAALRRLLEENEMGRTLAVSGSTLVQGKYSLSGMTRRYETLYGGAGA